MSSVCCAAVVTCEPPSQSPRGFFFTTSLSVNLFLDDWSVLSLSSIPSSPACLSVCLSQLIRHASSAPIKPGPHLEHKANVLCSCSECECVCVCVCDSEADTLKVDFSWKCHHFVSAPYWCHQMTMKMAWKCVSMDRRAKRVLNLFFNVHQMWNSLLNVRVI